MDYFINILLPVILLAILWGICGLSVGSNLTLFMAVLVPFVIANALRYEGLQENRQLRKQIVIMSEMKVSKEQK